MRVAVIDSGFDRYDPHFTEGVPNHGHIFFEEYYADLLAHRYTRHVVNELDPDLDLEGHGTAMISNLLAVAPGINLDVFRYDDAEAAFQAALAVNPDIISCSWGWDDEGPGEHPVLLALIRQAVANGIIVVFPVGNFDVAQQVVHDWPGIDSSVVSVGGVSVDSDGSLRATPLAFGGMTGDGRIFPDVCGIAGTLPKGILIEMPTRSNSRDDRGLAGGTYPDFDQTTTNDGWLVSGGTSSAVQQVAGLAALIKQYEPGINQGRFKHLVMTTCTDVVTGYATTWLGYSINAGPGFDQATGAGLIDCYRAVKTMVQTSSSDIYQPMTLPQGNHVNFYSFSGPHGASYHIDTTGSYTYGYTFFGYLASRDGAFMTRQDGIRVTGWFRQDDTFTPSLQQGRRYLDVYMINPSSFSVVASHRILDCYDGTDWTYRRISFDFTPPGWPLSGYGVYLIVIGRHDPWSTDWHLTGEWCNVQLTLGM